MSVHWQGAILTKESQVIDASPAEIQKKADDFLKQVQDLLKSDHLVSMQVIPPFTTIKEVSVVLDRDADGNVIACFDLWFSAKRDVNFTLLRLAMLKMKRPKGGFRMKELWLVAGPAIRHRRPEDNNLPLPAQPETTAKAVLVLDPDDTDDESEHEW